MLYQVKKLEIVPVAEDDVSLFQLLCVLRKCLRHTAGENDYAFRVVAFEFSDCLTCFSVAFCGYGTGVDNIDIGVFVGCNDFKAVCRHFFRHCLRFVLIDLAAECVKCDFQKISTPYVYLRYNYNAKSL